MSGPPLVIVGDTFLDRDLKGSSERLARNGPTLVVDDPAETCRPGGAGLAALLAAREGHSVVLVTALSADRNGLRLAEMLAAGRVDVIDLGLAGATPEKVRISSRGRELLRVDRGSRRPSPVGAPGTDALQAIHGARAILVSDYGGHMARSPQVREALTRRCDGVPLVWDPDPRGSDPVAGTLLATPNSTEAAHHAGTSPTPEMAHVVAQGRSLLARWTSSAVAITLGERGALLVASSGSVAAMSTTPVTGDCCGAGDSFAATVTTELAGGAAVDEAVRTAVAAATAFVAGGGVTTLSAPVIRGAIGPPISGDRPGDLSSVSARVRAEGGVVVATGGCFDLLHAGHLSVLSGARALGDCLVVCLNSDQSVRELKGPGRPMTRAEDRAALLMALPWVDEVIVFEETTPDTLLRRLQPDIWAKGGDYTVEDLPEAETVAGWGGQVVTLPYVEGCSTSRLLERIPASRR